MENTMIALATFAIAMGKRILGALLAYGAGRYLIRRILALLEKSRGYRRMEPSVQHYAHSAAQGVLIVILAISIVGILGVPMASVLTVLASAGVAVGLALQGSLSNLAGGIMLMNDKVCIPAYLIPVHVIAVRSMSVERQHILIADRHSLLNRSHLGIAFLGMGMFRNATSCLLQSNSRQNQSIDRAEHHHTSHAGHHPVPPLFSLTCLSIFLSVLQCAILHILIINLPIPMLRSLAGARPGIQFFRLFVPQKHIQ